MFDDTDECDITNFTLFRKNRGYCRNKSGGIGILVRNEVLLTYDLRIKEHVSFKKRVDSKLQNYYDFGNVEIPSEIVLLKLSNVPLLSGNTDFLLGAIYVPPEQSPYFNRNVFDDIENCLASFDVEHVLLAGDLNARTARLEDFIVDTNDTDFVTDSVVDCMTTLDIPFGRNSADDVRNNAGYSLVDFCKSQRMLIVNGRVGDDKDVGKTTCKNTSVVDYMIASVNLFPSFVNFAVLDFERCISDVHNAIFLELKICDQTVDRNAIDSDVDTQVVNDNVDNFVKPKWITGIEREFIENINAVDIDTLELQMLNCLDDIHAVSKQDINSFTDGFCNILKESAIKCNMFPKRSNARKSRKARSRAHKKCLWQNVESRRARTTYRNAARTYRLRGTPTANAVKNRAFKFYQKTLNKNFKLFIRDIRKRIRMLRTTDPSRYWKIINGSKKDKQEEYDAISHEVFSKHFEKLGNVDEGELFDPTVVPEGRVTVNEKLNCIFTKKEVSDCMKRLKNNKACGFDGVLNEFLKSSNEKIVKCITLLFNIVLITGKIPDSWTVGYITPIYKGKGDKKDPDNYRGITVLSCFGKLFTSLINDRIYAFLNDNDLLGNEQAGFRKNNSTTDQMFALHCIIDLYLQRKKKLFCTFIDYRKAFDTIQHSLLWEKLLSIGVNGNVISLIKNMYSNAKSCVKTKQGLSSFFVSNIGLRQGENLSPVLFSIFLNDLKDFLKLRTQGLNFVKNLSDDLFFEDIENYLNMFILLYADDTAILSESEKDMQECLNMLRNYCNIWGLHINVRKTKVMVFSRGKIRNIPKFTFGDENVDVVFQYKYLGLLFSYNNKFGIAIKDRVSLAKRAMFALIKKCRSLFLPLDIQFELFEKCIHPVLLYGCELWGFEKPDLYAKLQLNFLKISLGLRSSTPTVMVLGETGTYPIELEVKSRLLCFWYKLQSDAISSSKISCLMYNLIKRQSEHTQFENPWLSYVKECLNNLGLSYIFDNPMYSQFQFKNIVKRRLKDQYVQMWRNSVDTNGICCNYRIFKTEFSFEDYLLKLPYDLMKNLLKLRLCNNRLPVNSNRFLGVPRGERLCTLCDMNEIGDDFHYIFRCKYDTFTQLRNRYLKRYYLHHQNVLKYHELMNSKNNTTVMKLAKLVKGLLDHFSNT